MTRAAASLLHACAIYAALMVAIASLYALRTIQRDGETWWVLKDVCVC